MEQAGETKAREVRDHPEISKLCVVSHQGGVWRAIDAVGSTARQAQCGRTSTSTTAEHKVGHAGKSCVHRYS
eukprot:5214900-Amphidinium_carterae.1